MDGRVTRLWKVFFKPGSGYTDRLGVAIPIGDALDEVGMQSVLPLFSFVKNHADCACHLNCKVVKKISKNFKLSRAAAQCV